MVHVLLVEDNPADVLLIREGMRKSRIPSDVVIAYDGEEALKLLGTTCKFDLVILDLNVPKVNGHAFLERYRVHDGPPAVVFTGSLKTDDRTRALALGANDYVVKPRVFEEFVRAVGGILERWTIRQSSSTAAG